jgi:MraZ protein
MFLGQFYHNLDDKGRLIIPARYRDYLTPDGAYVMQGFDQNLMVLPTAKFEELSQQVNHLTLTDSTARLLKRLIFSTADKVEVDKIGRILLPQFLRQFAGLQENLVIVGAGNYFEIWSQDAWGAQVDALHEVQRNPDQFSGMNLAFP